MIYYILLPIFALLMAVFQATILDQLIFGKVGLEISVIFVIYAGFRLKALQGGVLSLLFGFFIDCVTGSLSGLHAFLYILLFFISQLFSFRIYAERLSFIAGFCFMSIFSQGILILFFYKMLYGFNVFNNILILILPQAFVGGIFGPLLFKLFNFVEVYLGYGNAEPLERA